MPKSTPGARSSCPAPAAPLAAPAGGGHRPRAPRRHLRHRPGDRAWVRPRVRGRSGPRVRRGGRGGEQQRRGGGGGGKRRRRSLDSFFLFGPWLGARVVADINCRPHGSAPLSSFSQEEEEKRILARNHEAGRTVLGIIGRDGALAEFVSLPLANLHRVPRAISDKAAAFAEPSAAALRVLEQGIIKGGDAVAVVGDGRLGFLVAACSVGRRRRQPRKEEEKWRRGFSRCCRRRCCSGRPLEAGPLREEGGESEARAQDDEGRGARDRRRGRSTGGRRRRRRRKRRRRKEDERRRNLLFASPFDVVVEASGSSSGVELALGLCRPLGTVVLKTTCAPPDALDTQEKGTAGNEEKKKKPKAVFWAAVANDAVVNEKLLVGCRCGPLEDALRALEEHAQLVELVESMVRHEFAIDQGVEALRRAAEPGALKVQVVFGRKVREKKVDSVFHFFFPCNLNKKTRKNGIEKAKEWSSRPSSARPRPPRRPRACARCSCWTAKGSASRSSTTRGTCEWRRREEDFLFPLATLPSIDGRFARMTTLITFFNLSLSTPPPSLTGRSSPSRLSLKRPCSPRRLASTHEGTVREEQRRKKEFFLPNDDVFL